MLFEIEKELNKIIENGNFIPTKRVDNRKKPDRILDARIYKTGELEAERKGGGYDLNKIKNYYKDYFLQGLGNSTMID